MNEIYQAYYESPIGKLEIAGDAKGIRSVGFLKGKKTPGARTKAGMPGPVADCLAQLDEYFEGRRKSFKLRLNPSGTEFQRKVWAELRKIPFGGTASYKDIAAAVGNDRATRAVGGANHNNPIGIIVPCHRVIGSDGRLTGYGGGLWRKEWLLAHEKRHR